MTRQGWISDRDILHSPSGWRKALIDDSANAAGRVLVTLRPGEPVAYGLSIQPDGSEQSRPVGTDDLYEQFQLDGTRLWCAYDGMTAPAEYRIILL